LPFSNRDVSRSCRKVLVVDDDADWRQFLKLCLEDLGYEAIEASDGEQALHNLEEDDYAVMLLDLHMPGMSGEDVLHHLPRRHPKVVFLTSAPAQEVGSVLMQGAHYYLPKGASRDQLSLMLQSLHL